MMHMDEKQTQIRRSFPWYLTLITNRRDPYEIRRVQTLENFKDKLKTYLAAQQTQSA